MAESPQMFKDSYAPVAIELGCEPNPYSGKSVPVTLPAIDMLISASIEYTASSAWKGQIVLYDPGELFLSGGWSPGKGARFFLKFDWDNNSASYSSKTPTFRGVVAQAVPSYEYKATKVTIDIVNEGLSGLSQDANRQPRTFKEGMKASDIVSAIAAASWPGTPTEIESSFGTIPHGFNLGSMSHWQFLQQKILPLARSEKNEAFQLFIDPRDDSVHFHTPTYRANKKKQDYVRHYVYARDYNGEVIQFTPSNEALFRAVQGGMDATYVTAKSEDGTYAEVSGSAAGGIPFPKKSDDEKAKGNESESDAILSLPPVFPGEEEVPDLTVGVKTKNAPAEQAYVHAPSRDIVQFGARSAAYYDSLRQRVLKASLTVKGTHAVRVGDVVRVDVYMTETNQPHYLSGLFRVNGVRQTLDSQGWQTEMELCRKGFSTAPEGVPTKAVASETLGVPDDEKETGGEF